jgi:hypothetical protein
MMEMRAPAAGILALFLATATHAAEPSVGGFIVGMDLAAVERVIEGYAKKGFEIKRTPFGPRANPSTPESVVGALSLIRIGAECSAPSGAHKCEQITVYFARPDLGGRVRGVESVQYLPDGTAMAAALDDLHRTYGPSRISRSYKRRVVDIDYEALGLLWGGESDRAESHDGGFPINAMRDDQRIGGKYVFAELWQLPRGNVRRVRVAAGDDELNIRQARAWSAEHERQASAERQRWRACVEEYMKEQQVQSAAALVVTAPEKKETLGYSGLGRVRFTLPGDLRYMPAVPHFTAGPRLLGADGCRERFEVSVYSYREPQTPAKWRAEMEKKLAGRVPVETLATNDALIYSTQTSRSLNAEWRFATYGALAAGRAVILFEHLSNDASHFRRDRLMKAIASAEFLDTDKWPSWDQIARDDAAWKAVQDADKKKDYPQSYVGAKQLCDQWTPSRVDLDSRALAGNACLHAAILLLTDVYHDGSPNRYGPTKGYLERALLAYGDADEFKEHRQSVYANLALVHGLGLGVAENLELARSYYAKEGTGNKMILAKIEGKVGPKTAALLRKLGH